MDPETLLVYEMNGQVLPREHGYPARLLVPGRYGMKNAKWVVALRLVSRDFVDWYGQRNWTREGIVKTMTRIDTPAPEATLLPGEHRLAGIAYAGDRGIPRVEYSTDDGMTWQDARFIEPAAGPRRLGALGGHLHPRERPAADADVARDRRHGRCPARGVQPPAAGRRRRLAFDPRSVGVTGCTESSLRGDSWSVRCRTVRRQALRRRPPRGNCPAETRRAAADLCRTPSCVRHAR